MAPEPEPVDRPRSSTKLVRRAYIHVGAPKTGTTYLQGVLWRNRTALRQAGMHIVGQSRGDHYRAGHDIREVPYDPKDPRPDWSGAWRVLAALAVDSEADNVIISDEHLASLTPDQVQRGIDSLAPREVHVIYATRNLARLLPSEYQEYVKHRSPLTYPDWVTKVFSSRRKGPGRWFWSVHDPVNVVERWSTAIPVERVHVLTLPPPGADKNELWFRFAGVIGTDPSVATEFDVAGNDSLGMAEAEVLRRVNVALPESFPRWHHTGLARDILATKILGPRSRSGRPRLPDPIGQLILERTEANISGLAASGCDIVGDLTVLEVGDDLSSGEPEPTEAEIGAAAVDAIAGLLIRMGRMRDDRRRAEGKLRRQLKESASMMRTRTRLAALADRTSVGSKALTRYRNFRDRTHQSD